MHKIEPHDPLANLPTREEIVDRCLWLTAERARLMQLLRLRYRVETDRLEKCRRERQAQS